MTPPPDPWQRWDAVETYHESRPPGGDWAEKSARKVDKYFVESIEVWRRDGRMDDQIPTVTRVDCRDGSCIAELEFPFYSAVAAQV